METQTYSRNELLNTLTKIGHGKLDLYIKPALLAGQHEPNFLAHFISWQREHGKVRDGKVALPVLALSNVTRADGDLIENAIAHLCSLSPRDLVRAWEFHGELVKQGVKFTGGTHKDIRAGIKRYLEFREEQPGLWVRQVIQHRASMKSLYNLLKGQYGIPDRARRVLFDKAYKRYKTDGVFAQIANINKLSALEAASVILKHKLPFEVIVGASSGAAWKVNSPEIVLALLEGMTGNQLVTNSKMLERMGVMKVPELRSAYDNALERARKDRKMDATKAGRAVEALEVQEEQVQIRGGKAEMISKLRAVGSAKAAGLKGIEGDWLVCGDKSGSMTQGIEVARMVAGFLASKVKGKVYLVFFDTQPYYFDVTGKGYDEITQMTKHLKAEGGTFIGTPVDYIMARGCTVDGIAVVSDGGENGGMGPGYSHTSAGRVRVEGRPAFTVLYKKYCEKFSIEPTVYMFEVKGSDPNRLKAQCDQAGIQVEVFDCKSGVDYYSIQAMGELMRSNRYGLVDEVMEAPLLTYDEVFKVKRAGLVKQVKGSWEADDQRQR